MRGVLLASLRTHTRRYVASALAVVIGVGFVLTVAAISSAARAGLVSAVGAPYAGADVVATGIGSRDVATVLQAAAQAGEDTRAEVVGSAYVPVRRDTGDTGDTGSTAAPLDELAGVGQTRPGDDQPWQTLTAGRYAAGAGEAVVDAGAAEAARVDVGDRLRIGEEGRDRTVTVVGLVAPVPVSSAAASLYLTAPDLLPFARDVLADSVTWTGPGSIAEQERTVEALVPGATVVPAVDHVDDLAARATRGVDVVALVLLVFAAVALFVSVLVIANSFAILVAQRQRELALLRCVGATRGQVRRSVRLEALVLGVVASGVGLLVGTATGAGAVGLLRARTDAPLGDPDVSWRWYAAAAVVGVVVTLVAAWVPTRRATRVAPLVALRPEPVLRAASPAGRARILVGVVVLVLGTAMLAVSVVGRTPVVMLVGGATVAVGVLLLGPVLVPPAIRSTGFLVGRLPGGAGTATRLAADNAVRNPRRTAATAASLLVGVTLTTAVLTGLASVRGAVDSEMDVDHPLDAALTAPAGDSLGAGAVTGIAALDGVGRSVPVAGTGASTRPFGNVTVLAPTGSVDEAVSYDPGALLPPDGTAYVAPEVLGADGLLPPRVELRVGDRTVTLRTELTAGGWGAAVLVSPETLAALTDRPTTTAVWLRADDGADATTLLDALDSQATAAGATLSAGYDSRAAADFQLDVVTGAVVGLLSVSVVIALVGIANTLGLSVLERAREHALLRALGLTRGQLRATLAVEALLLSVVVTVLGTLVGATFGWVGVQVLVRQVVETAPLVVPWGQLAAVVLASAVAGVLAAVLPARRAARTAPAAGLALD